MQRSKARLLILLIVALALLANAACSGGGAPAVPVQPTQAPTQTTRPAQPAAETATGAPTAQAIAEASATAEAPATPEPATATPEQPSPSVEAAAAREEILILVDADALAGVSADGTVRTINVPELDKETFQLVGSRDGRWLAGPGDQTWQTVAIYNVETAEARVFENHGGTVGPFHFSPDSTQLLFMVKNMNSGSWQLKTIDLASGESDIIMESADDPGYYPLAWTTGGILVTQILLLAADAPSSALHLLDPETGRMENVLPEGEPYIMAEPSHDGSKIAIVKGESGLHVETPMPSLEIVDVTTGATTEVEPAAPGYIYDVRWSPGGARALYAHNIGGAGTPIYKIAGAAGAPMVIDLSAAPGTVKDVVWETDDSLLVLLAEGGVEKLYHLPATSTDASALRELATIPSSADDRGSAILSLGR